MITNFVNCKRVFHKVFDIIVALSDQIVICQWTFKNLFQDINTFRTKSITLNGLRARDVNINPYWQIMENSSGNFTEIFIFRVVTQAVLLENSSIKKCVPIQFSAILRRHTDHFIGKFIH